MWRLAAWLAGQSLCAARSAVTVTQPAHLPASLLRLSSWQLVAKLVVITCPHPAAYKDPERFDGEMVSRWAGAGSGAAWGSAALLPCCPAAACSRACGRARGLQHCRRRSQPTTVAAASHAGSGTRCCSSRGWERRTCGTEVRRESVVVGR